MNNLTKISLRQQAIYIPDQVRGAEAGAFHESTGILVANLAKLGFGVSEELLSALNQTTPTFQARLLETFREVMGVSKNWTPLVKGWDTPTGESLMDHIITFFANMFKAPGTTLPCGHIIPPNTFPLERYNGCPFCGTPFTFGEIEVMGQGSKLKVLELWTLKELNGYLRDLLTSKTALDATQIDSLKMLLQEFEIPAVEIGMKETLMAVIDALLEQNQPERAQQLFRAPTDILRYLWYKKTGFLQLIEPRVIIRKKSANRGHITPSLDQKAEGRAAAIADLKLKYTRPECLRVATWLNNLPLDPAKSVEMMHPKRGMWVRFIRALRLSEYAKRDGFGSLKTLLDLFHSQKYEVWQGRLDHFRLKKDAGQTLSLLKQRPGLFARSLFANMLWFGPEKPLQAFAKIIDKVPARLVFTLNMYAENYFNPNLARTVKPLGGNAKSIPANPLLNLYSSVQLKNMQESIEDLCILVMKKRFARQENPNKTIYIDPSLDKMPVSIGDRSDQLQDLPAALMGTRFPLEGDKVRLFMQWGQGLPAQHLDMDLSCHLARGPQAEVCSYYNLVCTGCKHSGDIRSIPDKVGTAEYIEITVSELQKAGYDYVTFTCNAYSNGEITPNLVLGWMDSKFPMHISQTTGVAYDPSCVQHQVRITRGLSKGLVFGVLEVAKREVIWLEMPFGGQVVANLNVDTVKGLLAKLDSKLNVGQLLRLKAEAQGLKIVHTEAEADEAYTRKWALNAAAVTKLLVD
ncbi:MAG: hypothetical protein H6581_04990 [Bacteroidia bacterium]|nr:hypothetical protein [Bacteroidia bacterium]